VTADSDQDPRAASVDDALSSWRQGDCVLGEHWFAHRLNKSFTVTDAGRVAADADADLAEQQVLGLVVITQTCDIVRSCTERPYVEVCPLVEVDDDRLREVQRGRRPAYGFVPLVADRKLVADLDRVMTVEKPVVAGWERTPGWGTDAEARSFALALARKRVRFAFPDDFTLLAKKLQARLGDKHDKNTDEGRGLRALREIRVCASPSWDAPSTEIFFWFIRDDADATFEGKSWADLLKDWLKLVPATGRFTSIDGQVATLQEMTAQDYVDSDPLDLDHLSTIGGE
jgi:hypothetical protein